MPTTPAALPPGQGGDGRRALRELEPAQIEALSRPLQAMLRARGHSHDDIKEIVQDIWLRLLMRDPDKGEIRCLPAFLRRAAMNASNTLLRVAARQAKKLGSRVKLDSAHVPFDSFAQQDEEELLSALQAELRRLPYTSLRIITCRMEGLSFGRIGSKLGLHEAAVRRRFHEACEQLRDAVEASLYGVPVSQRRAAR